MRRLIQQVNSASIIIPKYNITHTIQQGIVIYMAIHKDDYNEYKEKIKKFIKKIQTVKMLRFSSEKINQSLQDINGEILLISNFTLYGRNTKSHSIDYTHSAPYNLAETIYGYCVEQMGKQAVKVKTGKFGAEMIIKSDIVGPINYIREY